jgi:hypothetical protein
MLTTEGEQSWRFRRWGLGAGECDPQHPCHSAGAITSVAVVYWAVAFQRILAQDRSDAEVVILLQQPECCAVSPYFAPHASAELQGGLPAFQNPVANLLRRSSRTPIRCSQLRCAMAHELAGDRECRHVCVQP